ncbi:aminotransferase class V-fold PLP-dependent enzyme [Eubacteriales bacterium OttesenSCG-928-K08]|nr:aminotransferase class V-fold PLP-dependent enzyme [Eubacteriales bacterium OttesenSCG-928-K08]
MLVNMNHAATSGTKPKEVVDAITEYINENHHQSVGRGGNELSTARMVFDSRVALAELFGASKPANVVFTSGATDSLNIAINGLVRPGCHVLATSLEHNAVARPLYLLQKQKQIEVTFLPHHPDGTFDPETISAAIRPNTRLLIMTHASNVLGNILPVEEAFKIAKQHGLFTVLDAAQTAGHMPVALNENTDIIAFTGHKGLRGVAGIGGLALGKSIASELQPYKAGGTGSFSHSLDMPDFLPDKLEPGTPNLIGIISLKAAAQVIQKTGFKAIREHEQRITTRFVNGLKKLPVTIYGNYNEQNWMPVVSINVPDMDAGALARRLFDEFLIETRSGLHCAPLAHKTIGTIDFGTLRFSFGVDTTEEEIDYTLKSLAAIIET